MRLIDADAFKNCWDKNGVIGGTMRKLIDDQPTIYPETLPIVRELREKPEKVTAERDALKLNPPVTIDSDTLDLAIQVSRLVGQRKEISEFLNDVLNSMENEIIVKNTERKFYYQKNGEVHIGQMFFTKNIGFHDGKGNKLIYR